MRVKKSLFRTLLVEELSPWLAARTDGGLGEQVTLDDYTSQNFDLCPRAVMAFLKIRDEISDEITLNLAQATMRAVDDMLGIEKDVMARGLASERQLADMLNVAGEIRVLAGQLGAMLNRSLAQDFVFVNDHIINVARMLGGKTNEV